MKLGIFRKTPYIINALAIFIIIIICVFLVNRFIINRKEGLSSFTAPAGATQLVYGGIPLPIYVTNTQPAIDGQGKWLFLLFKGNASIVTSVSNLAYGALVVGGGGGSNTSYYTGGGGGGWAYSCIDDGYTMTSAQSYNIIVGAAGGKDGSPAGGNGGMSQFVNMAGGGGKGAPYNGTDKALGGSWTGPNNGGNGGNGGSYYTGSVPTIGTKLSSLQCPIEKTNPFYTSAANIVAGMQYIGCGGGTNGYDSPAGCSPYSGSMVTASYAGGGASCLNGTAASGGVLIYFRMGDLLAQGSGFSSSPSSTLNTVTFSRQITDMWPPQPTK